MRGFEQLSKRFKVAGVVLLLLIMGLGTKASAQILSNPIPWPTPAAVPPPPPVQPPREGNMPTGFQITGFIQYASLDAAPGLCNKDDNPTPTPANPPLPAQCKITGGWVEVNNNVIRVPQSTVVIFPNTLLTWEEAFELNPNTHQTDPIFQTGLAMSDTVRFPGTYQVNVQGNIVNGQYIAGLVFIFQDPANFTQGYIEKFDYANGVMVVNGMRVQINDPAITFTVPDTNGSPLLDGNGNQISLTKGRYSVGKSADPRFAVDQNNPTVTSETGYPMCIPVTPPGTYNNDLGTPGVSDPYVLVAPAGFTLTSTDDPQCPEINRPRDPISGTVLRPIFTMNQVGDPVTVDNPHPQDPLLEMPFEVGDFVNIIGTLEMDDQGPFITATDVQALTVGAYTWPGSDPAYIIEEVVIQGTGGVDKQFFPQEAGVRTRVEGFTTDIARQVDVSAIDQDCNGNLTFREPAWTSNFPVEPGPPGIGVKGRWRMRFPQGGNFLPAVQNVGARVSGSVPGKNKNGLTYSEYQLPSSEFIFPENQVPGSRQPMSNFADILFLDNGMGQLPMVSDVFDSSQIQLGAPAPFFPNQVMGQLNPFPDNTLPPLTCVPGQITTLAVPKFISSSNPPFPGVTVTLDGTGSNPPTGPFQWAQILNPGDPVVTINNPTSAQATFVVPSVAGPQNLTFSLVVGGQGSSVPQSALASLIVPVILAKPGTAPVVSATASAPNPDIQVPGGPIVPPGPVTGTTITVASGATVTLSATCVDPADPLNAPCSSTFNWTQAPGNPAVVALSSNTGSTVTFTAPTVPQLTQAQTFTFTVTATSSFGSNPVSAPATVTVIVRPVSDLIVISNIVYRRAKGRLIVNVSDFTPNVTLTCTLDIINPATGLQWQGVMGPIIPFAQGVFSIRFSNIPPPNLVTITSDAGDVKQGGITFLR